jgi:ABC-type uncharacterized transport system permease subunit
MTAVSFAFANKIGAFEIGCQADNVEGTLLGLRHFILFSEV